ncbi:TonB-dependent receptor [Komagataeibacter sp. FXV3]|uniref:TonB-dependent receptor n=1 Tax=Komagataeibacter sp. FXV3 TaxID=2608998 RepID=UPI00187B697E|nr:TonB-dependent receptor [Komagataeibacter sp. FXV3]MBE7731395.1 TonB-dependent receptor [Komagataeibacter sp. FXV3]
MKRQAFTTLLTVSSALISFPAIAETTNNRYGHPLAARSVTHSKNHTSQAASLIAKTNEAIAVTGSHRSHASISVVSAKAINQLVPGTNPLKALAQLPGVMFNSDDPQGMDTWSTQTYMHGFMQNEIGFTLDGMPLGEQSYRNYNGLNSVAAISSENVARLDVSPSAGAESTPSTNNLGGSIAFISSDPKMKRGATVAQTFGSNATFHTFVRVDSGALNKTGTRFYASYMRNDAQKWKGYGGQFMQQVNAKFVQPIGENSRISAFFDYTDLEQHVYQDMSFELIQKMGYNLDDYYPNYGAAYAAAQGNYGSAYQKLSDPKDASYYDGGTQNHDYLGGITADLALTNRVRWKTTVYGHSESDHEYWVSPFYSSPNGAPLTDEMKQPSIRRFGIISSVNYNIAHNDIGMGVWYENNKYMSDLYGYEEPLLGQGSPFPAFGDYKNAFTKFWGQTYNTNTFTAFFQDTYHPLPGLALHFGFKSLLTTTRVGATGNNEAYTGVSAITGGESLTVAKPFLPHISGNWHFLRKHELFFDIAENVHSFSESGYNLTASPMAVSQAQYDTSRGRLKPETAWSYSVGYRYTGSLVQASIYAYRADFNNRLQQISSGSITNPVTSVLNVGSVSMNGVDAGLTITPIKGLTFSNNISYNHSTYGQDLTINSNGVSTTYNLHGQQVVAYPRFMYKTALAYNWRGLEAHVDASYMSQRNFSYVGNYKAPAYWLANAGLRYSLGALSKYNRHLASVQNLIFSFDVYNLANERYIATMGENGYPLNTDYQSMLIGAPRQFFGTIKAEF